MSIMKDCKKELDSIQEKFFEIDKENKTVLFRLEFERPGELFVENLRAKIPVMTEEFLETIIEHITLVPDKYKCNIDVTFDDFEGWSETELIDICKQNLLLFLKRGNQKEKENNRLAISMAVTGIVFIIISIMVNRMWADDSFLFEIVAFILDIVATVPFWGAMDIYFIENKERRKKIVDVTKRFESITFHQKKTQ